LTHTTGIGGGRHIPRVNTACRWPAIGLFGNKRKCRSTAVGRASSVCGRGDDGRFFFLSKSLVTADSTRREGRRTCADDDDRKTSDSVSSRRARMPRTYSRQSRHSSSSSSSVGVVVVVVRDRSPRDRASEGCIRDPSAPWTSPRPDPFFSTLARTRSHTAAQSILPKVKTPTRCVCTRAPAASSPLRCSKKKKKPLATTTATTIIVDTILSIHICGAYIIAHRDRRPSRDNVTRRRLGSHYRSRPINAISRATINVLQYFRRDHFRYARLPTPLYTQNIRRRSRDRFDIFI